MNKRIFISILFGFFLLVGFLGLTKIVTSELDTTSNTNIIVYGEANDLTDTSKTGATETVNLTVDFSSTYQTDPIVNITVWLQAEGNYTFGGFVNTIAADSEILVSNETDQFSQNSTTWTDGTIADWNCTNISLYIVNCENKSSAAALSATNGTILIRFNVTAASITDDSVALWNLTTWDSELNVNETTLNTTVDGSVPRIQSINITDGNVTWQNGTELNRWFEVDNSSTLTVYATIDEVSSSNHVYLIYSTNGSNVTTESPQYTWNQMTEVVAPDWRSPGVYSYNFYASAATNFMIVANDTYNQVVYVNDSTSDPFVIYGNDTLVEVIGINISTVYNGITSLQTSPLSATYHVKDNNATINIVVGGEYKGPVEMYFSSNGSLTVDGNGDVNGHDWVTTVYDGAVGGTFNNLTQVEATAAGTNALYLASVDLTGNKTNSPKIAIIVNSTNSYHGDGATANLANYSSYAIYTFNVDGDTPTPTIDAPSDTTVTINDVTGITYGCDSTDNKINTYLWTLTSPKSTTTYTTTSDSITFSESDINTAGSHNVKCRTTDNVGNRATSATSSFTVSHQTISSTGTGPGGSSSSGVTPTVSFDVDFSKSATGTINAQQGRIKSFSFDGSTKHTVTFDEVTASSATVTIASSPITITLNARETKEIDINGDGINDMSVTLKSIVNGLASLEMNKIEAGAQIVEKEEKEAAGIVDEPTTTTPREEVQPVSKTNMGLWITLLVILAVIVVGYLAYRKK